MNKSYKKLSIITVTKNCYLTLEKTILSVKEIKNKSIEYIIIDGKSTDGTLEILEKHKETIDFYISEADSGIYNAMNKGVTHATGDYILFINGDDELISDGFPDALENLKKGEADIISAITLVGDGKKIEEKLIAKPSHLLFYNSIPHPSSFVKKQLLISYPFQEELKIAADYDFFLNAYIKRNHFAVINSNTALHSRGGASSNTELSQKEVELIKKRHLGNLYSAIAISQKIYRLTKRFFKK